MSKESQEFINLMNNSSYWNQVNIDKGQENEPTVLVRENIEDLEFELFDRHYEEITDTQESMDLAISIHADKRSNRKYEASRKFLIKDKKSLFFKALPSLIEHFQDIEEKLAKTSTIVADNCIFIKEVEDIKISEYSVFEPVKVLIRKDYIISSNVKELTHLPKIRVENRKSYDIEYLANYDTLKIHFFGKPIIRTSKKDKVFCEGKSLTKKYKVYSHERETPNFIRQRELDKIDFSFDSLNETQILESELKCEEDYSYEHENDLGIVFKVYTEEEMFSVDSIEEIKSDFDIMDQITTKYEYDEDWDYDLDEDWDEDWDYDLDEDLDYDLDEDLD